MQDTDIKKLKELLLPDLQNTIQAEIKTSHDDLSSQIDGVKSQMDAVKLQIKPIADVYSTVTNSGTVFRWLFQNIVIPLSVIVGILLTINNLRK